MRPAAKTILLSREALFPSLFIQVKLGITFIFCVKHVDMQTYQHVSKLSYVYSNKQLNNDLISLKI